MGALRETCAYYRDVLLDKLIQCFYSEDRVPPDWIYTYRLSTVKRLIWQIVWHGEIKYPILENTYIWRHDVSFGERDIGMVRLFSMPQATSKSEQCRLFWIKFDDDGRFLAGLHQGEIMEWPGIQNIGRTHSEIFMMNVSNNLQNISDGLREQIKRMLLPVWSNVARLHIELAHQKTLRIRSIEDKQNAPAMKIKETIDHKN